MVEESSSHEVTDKVADRAHGAVDRAAESAGRAEERIREGSQRAQDRSQDLMSSVNEYVRENPVTAIGIAFIAGMLVSSWTRR